MPDNKELKKKAIENLSVDLLFLLNERAKIDTEIENINDIFVEIASKEG